MIFDGGVENEKFNIYEMELKIRTISKNNPSVSFAASSLYTREPDRLPAFLSILQMIRLVLLLPHSGPQPGQG